MTCSICYQPYFPFTPKDAHTRGSTGLVVDTAHRPAALGCGHTFHEECIEEWFKCDHTRRCPQCKAVHASKVTVLYIDIDEEDYEASRSVDGLSNMRPGSYGRRGNADTRQLAWDINDAYYDKMGRDYHVICELARRNRELEAINMDLEEELEEAHRSLVYETAALNDKLDELTLELDIQRRLHRQTEALLDERYESLRREKEILECRRREKECLDSMRYERERADWFESKLETMQALVHRLLGNNSSMQDTMIALSKEMNEY
ncbi:hypothetical protein GGI20_003903 [Coemansia sp. BCRC 34301]|nr:hypothetical protein GGI20_003903 [Coemansia sp. BCRC 34301]